MRYFGWAWFFLMSISAWCQLEHPKASPFATIAQEIGLSKISVSYSRPAARGRVLFGNQPNGQPGLVPNGRIWRVGANASTKITFDTDVSILGNVLSKGTYALYAFPEAEAWQLIFHNNISHWGDGRQNYDPQEDALRVKVKPFRTLNFQENFLISFDAITHNGLEMLLTWGNLKMVIPIQVDTPKMMEAQIQKTLENNPTAQSYYEIARYYQEQGVNFKKALDYVNLAIELHGSTYYYHRIKSLLLADMGDHKNAILESEISKKIAYKEGKDEFVRLSDNDILNWKKIKIKKEL